MKTATEYQYPQAGNWKSFGSFCWDRQFRDGPADIDNWTIYYTHHRDSDALARANAVVIDRTLEPFADADNPDVLPESHSHFAVGWIDGWAVRVTSANGEPTPAYAALCDLIDQMADYPVLDDEVHSQIECDDCEATWSCFSESDRAEYLRKHVHDLTGKFRSLLAAVKGSWSDAAELLPCPSDLLY